MTIKPGDTIPTASFTVMTADGPKPVTTDEIFAGKKVVLVGVPGAFTPTCSTSHLPPFLEGVESFKAKGVDEIAVVSVNDVFVMNAWAKALGGEGKITFLADGSGAFVKAIGLTLDLNERGLGTRSQRYAMLVDNKVVKTLNIEETPGTAETSGAAALLKTL
jgi:glutaredoxin/glutathione-dependent peroxiredoxin